MTTLIGIKATKGEPGIILASDLSRTYTEWKSRGDHAYRQQTKHEGQKLYVDNKRELAVGMSGVFDQNYIDFLSALLEGDIDFRKAIEEGYFTELVNLNLKRWDGKFPDNESLNGLMIATRFDNPRLFACYPLGRTEERPWLTIGSGSEYATNSILKQEKLIPRGLELRTGIDLTIKSLDEASQDIYTGGLDLVVVKKDSIEEYGQQIRDSIATARADAIKKL